MSQKSDTKRGVVLIIVLVVIVVLALAAYSFCELSVSHRAAAKAVGRSMQSAAFVDSGVQFIVQVLSDNTASEEELADNPALFQSIAVLSDDILQDSGGFSIISPALDDEGQTVGLRFGLADESNRLNLNLLKAVAERQDDAGRQMLMALPGMSLETADAILDWLDSDNEPRPLGVESEYYTSLSPPYAAANCSLTSIEELLLVRGVTRELLFGQDQNQNYVIDPSEATLSSTTDGIPFDESNPCGWAAHLTLFSRDRPNAEDPDEAAIHVNQDDMQNLYDELLAKYNKEWAMFIVAYRQNGPFNGPSVLDSAVSRDLDLSQPGRFPITQALDLIGQNVQVTLAGDSEPVTIASPFKEDIPSLEYSLQELHGNLVLSGEQIPGRVNIMQAPRVVLRTIPGIDDATVDEILLHREMIAANTPTDDLDPMWLLTEGLVTLDEMRALAPYVNVGGAVFRAQVVGHFQDGRNTMRSEVIVDAGGTSPRLVQRRDLTHLTSGSLLNHILNNALASRTIPVSN